MKIINITPLTKKYGPGYVARDTKTGRVVAHAARVDILVKEVKDTKAFQENKLLISWVPKPGTPYVFALSL